MNLTVNGRIEDSALEVCSKDLEHLTNCVDPRIPGHTVQCMTQHLNMLQVLLYYYLYIYIYIYMFIIVNLAAYL